MFWENCHRTLPHNYNILFDYFDFTPFGVQFHDRIVLLVLIYASRHSGS
jgi:hypothetical protein